MSRRSGFEEPQKSRVRNHRYFVGGTFLSSCNTGQANVSHPQQQRLFTAAPGSPIAVACGPGNVVVGDLNNDGNPDLVVACGQARIGDVLVGTGRPEEKFRASIQLSCQIIRVTWCSAM